MPRIYVTARTKEAAKRKMSKKGFTISRITKMGSGANKTNVYVGTIRRKK